MGLFSFLKGAGSDALAKKEAEEKAKDAFIQATADAQASILNQQKQLLLFSTVQNLGYDVQDLSISLENDVVTVGGQVNNQADKEKIILALGNMAGIAAVNDDMTVSEAADESTFYEVQSGDSLSKIAKKFMVIL